MLVNIDQSVYAKFKSLYRKRIFREHPVSQVSDLVQLGYLDVCRTIRGIGKNPKQSQFIKEGAIQFVSELLRKPPSSQSEFDSLHHQCCQLCANAHGTITLHYGQAQKLVNMSLKYLYNEYALYKGEQNVLGFPNTNLEYYFHLPVDKQILDCLVDRLNFSSPRGTPWSKWRFEDYIAFQHELRERLVDGYVPLEIDYLIWNQPANSLGGIIVPKIS